MSDNKVPPNTNPEASQDRRGEGERRRESKNAADVLGWDGFDRRQQDRRAIQERRQAERIERAGGRRGWPARVAGAGGLREWTALVDCAG